jgi:hypothetical protein
MARLLNFVLIRAEKKLTCGNGNALEGIFWSVWSVVFSSKQLIFHLHGGGRGERGTRRNLTSFKKALKNLSRYFEMQSSPSSREYSFLN